MWFAVGADKSRTGVAEGRTRGLAADVDMIHAYSALTSISAAECRNVVTA